MPTRPKMKLMENKVVVVTGSSRGIGRATALEFSRSGAKVVINYFRSEEQANSLKRAIDSESGSSRVIMADVTRNGSASRLIGESLSSFGKIDVLFNNAGTTL